MIDPKIQIRPVLANIRLKENISKEEKFQNDVLRPIIKLQHELLLSYFEHYLSLNKIKFHELSEVQKEDFVQKTFKRNNPLKTDLRGLIIGLFTLEEYVEYLSLTSEINRRINSIVQKRISSTYLI